MTKNVECLLELENEGLPEDFGKLIKAYRLKRGYSLAQLEKLTKVSPSYISRIERSLRNEVSFAKALRICFSLGIPYEEMISKAFGEIEQFEVDREKPALADILFHNDFTIQERTASLDEKEVVVSVINYILDCKWDSETKISDLYQISKKVEKLKSML